MDSTFFPSRRLRRSVLPAFRHEAVIPHVAPAGILKSDGHSSQSSLSTAIKLDSGLLADSLFTSFLALNVVTSRATLSARRTRTLTSARDPSRLRIDMMRSTVNRPRSALWIREKSAAANARAVVRGAHGAAMRAQRSDGIFTKRGSSGLDYRAGRLHPIEPSQAWAAGPLSFARSTAHSKRFMEAAISSARSVLLSLSPYVR